MQFPTLETRRLVIRPFELQDLQEIHRILDLDPGDEPAPVSKLSLDERRRWLEWTVLNDEQLDLLLQPPYGDRAVTLKPDHRLIGAVGLVPCLAPFSQLHSFGGIGENQPYIPQVGLYYAIAPAQRGKGYATEAARALVDYAFSELKLERIVALTRYENLASQAVMRRLGMGIESNPYPEPAWMQIVGVCFRFKEKSTY